MRQKLYPFFHGLRYQNPVERIVVMVFQVYNSGGMLTGDSQFVVVRIQQSSA